MGKALKGVPEYAYPVPDGVLTQPVETSRGTRNEYFYAEFPQTNPELGLDNTSTAAPQTMEEGVKDLLF